MERGYCGLCCTDCDAFIATKNNDLELKEKTAKSWSEVYKVDIKPEDINCTGCKSSGVKFTYPSYMCEVRKCNVSSGYNSCGECKDYACEKISHIIDYAPDVKEYLESKKKH